MRIDDNDEFRDVVQDAKLRNVKANHNWARFGQSDKRLSETLLKDLVEKRRRYIEDNMINVSAKNIVKDGVWQVPMKERPNGWREKYKDKGIREKDD